MVNAESPQKVIADPAPALSPAPSSTSPSPANSFRYKAFISYSWKDKAAAEALHHALETWRSPKALGGMEASLRPIFRDRDEEAAGANLRAAIEDGLDNSEFLIVLCSPHSAGSKWVAKEIAYFRKRRTPNNVLCYIIAGDPAKDCFPQTILFESTVDGAVSDTPIEAPLAADARSEGDGPRLARLKLIAALLGVGLDALIQRDQQRRVKRLRALLGFASAIAVGFAGVAAYALIQRNIAVENEARAKRESLKAERTAEFMVSLFEVPDPSESRGRDVTAKEILDKGVATIETDLAAEPDVQASLMHTMGRSYTGLGLYPDAARLLAVARDKRAVAKADPADVFATENALARALFEAGDLDGAQEIYEKLVKEAEDAVAKGGWRVDYATALIGMGETTVYRDMPEEAQSYYERARDLLAAHGMSESEEMAEALQGLAGARMDQRDFVSAEANYLSARRIYAAHFGADDFRVALVNNDLGNLFYFDHRLGRASELFNEALKTYLSVLGPSHPDTLIMQNNIARIALEGGDLKTAETLFLKFLEQSVANRRDEHFDFVFPLNSLAEIELDEESPARATEYLEQALNLPGAREGRMAGPIMLNAGRAKCALNDAAAGVEEIRMGRRALDDHYDALDWRYGVADEYESRCLIAEGDDQAARALAKSGYERLKNRLGADHYFTRRAKTWMEHLSD